MLNPGKLWLTGLIVLGFLVDQWNEWDLAVNLIMGVDLEAKVALDKMIGDVNISKFEMTSLGYSNSKIGPIKVKLLKPFLS